MNHSLFKLLDFNDIILLSDFLLIMRQVSFGNFHCKRLAKYTIVCHHYIIFMLMMGVLVVSGSAPHAPSHDGLPHLRSLKRPHDEPP